MTCNTISLVSRLIWKRFWWKFIDIFEDVCSLHICFTADSFHLLCCITPCESSGRFHRRKLLLGPGAQAPHFYDHGARLYMTSPHFCDVILSKLCFSCSHWFYAMPTNRQLDHSLPAVLDIFGKGLNLPAPLDIQWLKCFQLQGGFAPLTPWPGALPLNPAGGSASRPPLYTRAPHSPWCPSQPLTPPAAYDPRASSPPLILTTLRL